ncbi:MAG: TonB family protein [Deltaproteobacteria bacterium]|nr:TonB family protein [Deltaproteobacteria bacterium]
MRSAIVAARTYPAPARRTRAEGRVVLRVRVDGRGRVAGATIEERSSHDLLDRAALAMARGIPSLPPPPGGPIDVEVPVVYSLRGPH